jgi:hypothetical protein
MTPVDEISNQLHPWKRICILFLRENVACALNPTLQKPLFTGGQ